MMEIGTFRALIVFSWTVSILLVLGFRLVKMPTETQNTNQDKESIFFSLLLTVVIGLTQMALLLIFSEELLGLVEPFFS